MTTISTTCEGCGRPLAVPERYQGRDLKCPSCGRPFRVDPVRAAPTAPTAPDVEVFPSGAEPAPPAAPFGEPVSPAAPPAPAAAADASYVEATAVYWRVRSIGVLSLAAMSALLHAALGLLLGLAVAAASLTPAARALPFVRGPLIGALAVLLLPPVYAAIGFVAGALTAFVYNLAAKVAGGVRLLLE